MCWVALDRGALLAETMGNADLVEVGMALEAHYGADTGLDFARAREVSRLVRERSGYALAPWKAIVGENLFVRESGAVATQFHDPPAIEPFGSELVGAAAERRIVLGKKSGADSVRLKLAELGLALDDDERRAELLRRVKDLGTRERRLVADDEFAVLAREVGAA